MEEPARKSFLDVLKRNLSLADRFSFITRLVYTGEYFGTDEQLLKKVKHIIKELNEEHGEIVLTGIFLVFPKYFIHLIEASEETIYRHFQSVVATKNSEGADIFGHIILLPAFYNVFRCYFLEWSSIFIPDPPESSSIIEDTELSEIQNQVKLCLSETYELAEYLHDKGEGSHERVINALKNIVVEMPHLLPEVTRIEYLLSVKSPAIQDLRDYLKKFEEIPFFNFYRDRIWPPPKNIVPELNYHKKPGKKL